MLEGLTPPSNKTVFCKIDNLAAEMTPEDRAIFMAAIADHITWPANTLSNALRQRSVSVADVTITKHRLRTCACFRD